MELIHITPKSQNLQLSCAESHEVISVCFVSLFEKILFEGTTNVVFLC